MSLGEESRIENICNTAAYKEVELEELIGTLKLERNLNRTITSIINQYNNGQELTERQENVLCYEYIKRYNKNIYLIG